MYNNKQALFLFCLTFGIYTQASVSSQQVLKELKGKSAIQHEDIKQIDGGSESKSLNEKRMNEYMSFGQEAFQEKKYKIALKHFNTVIQQSKHTNQIAAAYLAKSEMYLEMGLSEQSRYNYKIYEEKSKFLK